MMGFFFLFQIPRRIFTSWSYQFLPVSSSVLTAVTLCNPNHLGLHETGRLYQIEFPLCRITPLSPTARYSSWGMGRRDDFKNVQYNRLLLTSRGVHFLLCVEITPYLPALEPVRRGVWFKCPRWVLIKKCLLSVWSKTMRPLGPVKSIAAHS